MTGQLSGTQWQQAMLNDHIEQNNVEWYNVTKYNEASGYGCCCNLGRMNKFFLLYMVLFVAACGTAGGAQSVCHSSTAGMVVLCILSGIIMWAAGGCLFLESRYLLAPVAEEAGPIKEKTYDGSTMESTGPNAVTQVHHVTKGWTNFDPYRDSRRFGIFCILWTIAVIAAPISMSNSKCWSNSP